MGGDQKKIARETINKKLRDTSDFAQNDKDRLRPDFLAHRSAQGFQGLSR